MTLDRQHIAKIAKLIPRLASNHDGEVVATVRAIVRTLGNAGADLHDLVAELDKPAVERVVYRDRPAPRPGHHKAATPVPPLFRADALRLAGILLHDCDLSPKAAGFVAFVFRVARSGGDRVELTEKQMTWFLDLVQEHQLAPERAA
ncbi:MAG: hypothetical protein E5Y73_11445 [Mesorhizobium sp.]|uniref:hypothetical protein n=1 Tax=Mesorhizobium sp. TaxID=1871066 RepID=UPI0011F8FF10|nr:hypothetical protein [Mesorhizobium sp.]TIL94526.1 MAG: hypothetical protein E5Y73_11445 [Mesorhizobium sp.]